MGTSKEPVLGRKFKGKVPLPGEPGYLTPGEQGYLATMRQLLEEALNDPRVTSILVFDDDALLHCNFAEELRKLLSEERCGGLVEAESTGGVLLLGSALWINGTYPERGRWTGGWAQVDHDMEVIRQRTGHSTQCFNVDRKTMGTFGVIYHRQVFAPIIEWTLRADEPFDHLWPHLTSMGFPVRAGYRSLVVQDVRHQSSVDPSRKGQEDFLARAQKHHWDMTQYCDPNTEQPVIPPRKPRPKWNGASQVRKRARIQAAVAVAHSTYQRSWMRVHLESRELSWCVAHDLPLLLFEVLSNPRPACTISIINQIERGLFLSRPSHDTKHFHPALAGTRTSVRDSEAPAVQAPHHKI